LLALLLALVCVQAAQAGALQLAGKFGYLGEYEFSARVAAADGASDYSGPLLVRHVGLCTHDGPQQVSGEITLRVAQANARIQATLNFDGRRCTFSGALSPQAVGELVCADAAVPTSLWSSGQ
jgi:hypothetical protein